MKLPTLFLPLVVGLAGLLSVPAARAEDPVLERYALRVGDTSDGIAAAIQDRFFANGLTRAAVQWVDTSARRNGADVAGSVTIYVGRQLGVREPAPALRCTKVEVRGYDGAGEEIYATNLPAFTFARNQNGSFVRSLRLLPLEVALLRVSFYGRYE